MNKLVDQWFDLLNYCKSADFDQDVFKVRHDSIAHQYKRLSVEQQGEYTYLISERL